MRHLLAVLILCFSAVSAQAAELVWDAQTITSPLMVERSATQTGPYTTVATLPTGATRFILTPGAYGWYRVSNSAGPSNVVQFAADLFTGPVTTRLDTLEAQGVAQSSRIATLESGLGTVSNSIAGLPYAAQISALASRVTALEATPVPPVVVPPPVPTSNLTTRQLDADRIEIAGTGCTSLRTTGTGLRRIVECVH